MTLIFANIWRLGIRKTQDRLIFTCVVKSHLVLWHDGYMLDGTAYGIMASLDHPFIDGYSYDWNGRIDNF
jgi:hypothetical protein